MRVLRAKRFTTSLPIIAIPAFCAQGFLRPFEKENPFCYRKYRNGGREGGGQKENEIEGERGLWRKAHMGKPVYMQTAHAHICSCIGASTGQFIYSSEQLFVCLNLSPSATAVQRGHQLASGIREKLLA